MSININPVKSIYQEVVESGIKHRNLGPHLLVKVSENNAGLISKHRFPRVNAVNHHELGLCYSIPDAYTPFFNRTKFSAHEQRLQDADNQANKAIAGIKGAIEEINAETEIENPEGETAHVDREGAAVVAPGS